MRSFAIVAAVVMSVVFSLFTITCTGRAPQTNWSAHTSSPTPASGNLPLRTLRDVPLSGGTTRFDYQSFDSNTGRLYIAHLGDGSMVVFDTAKETQVGDVKTFRAYMEFWLFLSSVACMPRQLARMS